MKIVDAIESRPRGRVKITFTDGSSLRIRRGLVSGEGLAPGRELSPAQVEELAQEELYHRALEGGLRYISYRQRSVAEVRARLSRDYPLPLVEEVIAAIKERGLLDDTAFAQQWRQGREGFRPRSRALIYKELRGKGVEQDIAAAAVEGLDEEESCYRSALPQARKLAGIEPSVMQRRLTGFLRRRGFSYEVIRHIVERLRGEKLYP